MSLAHDKLYTGKSFSRINMKEYITELVQFIERDSGIPPERVRVQLELEKLELLFDIAIPCGLIINELVANCFIHAFVGGRKGGITVSLHKSEMHLVELMVSDDGIGLPPGFDIMKPTTLGLQIVLHIASHQLHASITTKADQGLQWKIQFRDDLYSERVQL
jgi:two-component sensor histidine kinase